MSDTRSDRPRVLATRKFDPSVEKRLQDLFDMSLNADDTVYSSDEMIKAADGCDGLMVTPTEKLSPELIAALPSSIRIISTFSVGYDHINVPAAVKRDICVTNTPDVLTDATADIALLLMLGAARGAYWGERMVRENRWGAWSPLGPLGLDVTGKRLGIIGMGRIGRAVAHRARAFDMEIHYHNRSELSPELAQGALFHAHFDDMLPYCDFLSINCASTPETRKLINAERLAKLPPRAIVVNTARGDIVDDDALITALQNGELAAAGLDVFAGEPNIDPRYRELGNVFLLPHLGSATENTRIAMGMRAVDNLEAFFNGLKPKDRVTS